MKKISFLVLLNIYLCAEDIIKGGVYNMEFQQYYLQHRKKEISLRESFRYPNTFFRIYKISKYNYYYIENIINNFGMTYSKNNKILLNKIKNESSLWEFNKINNNKYIIRNKNKCYIKIYKHRISCQNISLNEASEFILTKIYEENNVNFNLIENEPIDILIKYIDLRDQNLKRKEIHQIEKDYDNEELKYSIRSVLINIPWIRKIFILMPNEKVRFFKDYKLIKNKINYVKDRALLGYDSSDSNSIQFNIWKMNNFGISNNFIIMDDDCFIGKKLEKNDFFYVEKGKVVPLIITSNFMKINENEVKEYYKLFKYKAKNTKEEQNKDIFFYSLYLTYLFVLKIFKKTGNESIFIPRFTHNAIPVNLNELKDIYNIVYKSKYRQVTLNTLYRHIGFVQFQTFYISYNFIKHNKKVKDIPYNYIDINNSIISDYKKYSLFCINTGSSKYFNLTFYKAKIIMEYLFPYPTPYEKKENSFINLSFITIYSMENIIRIYQQQFIKKKEKKNSWIKLFMIIFILISVKYLENN